MSAARYVAAIDQGTTSTRCMIFDHAGNVVCFDQQEHRQIYPQPGWVEHDPREIWEKTQAVVRGALAKGAEVDLVHLNSNCPDSQRLSDHDPVVARLAID